MSQISNNKGNAQSHQRSDGDDAPVSFEFEQPVHSPLTRLTNRVKGSGLWLGLFIAMAVALYWVVIELPQGVSTPQSSPTVQRMPAQPKTPIEQAPWQSAQQKLVRTQAQEVLAQLLEQQQRLMAQRVDLWADTAYQTALTTAQLGDQHYQQHEFTQAIDSYQQATRQLSDVEDTVNDHFEHYLNQGISVLNRNNAAAAKEQLTIALYLIPNDQRASVAFDRALVFDEVTALLNKGHIAQQEQKLAQAQEAYEQALALDPHSELAKERVSHTKQQILTQRYQQAMSQGYNHLHHKRYAQANQLFKKAKSLIPNKNEPNEAIIQVANQQASSAIDKLIATASSLEAQEQWQRANQTYQQAQSIDGSVLSAKLGVLRTNARWQLDTTLVDIIKQPLALKDETLYQQANMHYASAARTKAAGPRLLAQLNELKTILTQARQAITVTFESDNHTKISLYRVASLGQFVSKQLALPPGEYTIVGAREGYQDVRQQFVLQPNGQSQVIVIQCDKKVTNG